MQCTVALEELHAPAMPMPIRFVHLCTQDQLLAVRQLPVSAYLAPILLNLPSKSLPLREPVLLFRTRLASTHCASAE
jgi:hypothetical protein